MNNHKAVTEKVLEANRRNAAQSTGPKSAGGKLAVRYNAVKHGLLAKQILFRHDKVRQEEFNDFLDELECDLMPVGPVERMLVEEIGACWWKLQEATRLEFKELRNHRNASKQVIAELKEAGADLNLFAKGSGNGSPPTWGCEKLVVRRSKGNSHTEGEPSIVDKGNLWATKSASSDLDRGCLEVEATLTSSLPTILRYETNLKRDYYNAIHTLRDLQRRRQGGNKEKQKSDTAIH
jgi:hypothetical protein